MAYKLLSGTDYEEETVKRALKGNAEAGIEALRLYVTGCDAGTPSQRLIEYVRDRLAEIVFDGERPDRALRVFANKKRGPEYDPTEIAATYFLLLKCGYRPEAAKQIMQERIFNTKPRGGIDRRLIERTAKSYAPTQKLDHAILLHMTGSVRKKVAKLIPETCQA